MRLREIAVSMLMEATAHDRLRRALKSKAGTPGEQLNLKPGDLVDFWRAPYTKDISGWLGPAIVVNTTEQDRGNIDVKWQGHIYSVSIRHVRRALVYHCFIASDGRRLLSQDASIRAVQERIHQFPAGNLVHMSAFLDAAAVVINKGSHKPHALISRSVARSLSTFQFGQLCGRTVWVRFGIFAKLTARRRDYSLLLVAQRPRTCLSVLWSKQRRHQSTQIDRDSDQGFGDIAISFGIRSGQ